MSKTDAERLAEILEWLRDADDKGGKYPFKDILRLLSAATSGREGAAFDFAAHLRNQREWSERTFGPGARTAGVIDHIRKELREIEADPLDVAEWIDVVILALDGAWRAGYSPDQIIGAIRAKQAKNEARAWPDWRTADPDKAIEHVRSARPDHLPCARCHAEKRRPGHPYCKGCHSTYQTERLARLAAAVKETAS